MNWVVLPRSSLALFFFLVPLLICSLIVSGASIVSWKVELSTLRTNDIYYILNAAYV